MKEGRYSLDDYWKTEKARFLDNPQIFDELMQAKSSDINLPTPEQTADEINSLLLAELAGGRGVHVETALTTVGALAGFSCQMAIRDGFITDGQASIEEALIEIKTTSGELYYSGSLLIEGLASNNPDNYSVWRFIGGAVQQSGRNLPDMQAILDRKLSEIGTEAFLVPNIPAEHVPSHPAQDLLWKYWNITRNILVLRNQAPPLLAVCSRHGRPKIDYAGARRHRPNISGNDFYGIGNSNGTYFADSHSKRPIWNNCPALEVAPPHRFIDQSCIIFLPSA